ncbi:hypothetical protein ABZY93_26640 [Streptomyces smyrnaeus]|uniref:acyltransferase family protein n=1 Tax=Streptomyces smyrnaeus TaxID=1387713 RepID=UPI0033AA3B5E
MAWDPFTDPFATPGRTAHGAATWPSSPTAAAPRGAPAEHFAAARSAPTVSTVGPFAQPAPFLTEAGPEAGAGAADDAPGAAPAGTPPPGSGLPAPASAPPSSGTRRRPRGRRGAAGDVRAAEGPHDTRGDARTGAQLPAGALPGGRARLRRPHGASAVGRAGMRDPFLDNARFLLVVLVVLGHNWAPVADAMRGVEAASLLLYSFHLPALALLCGHLSRSFTARPDQVRRLLTHVLVPYLVFEAAYAGMHTLFWDRPFTVSPTRPAFVCWFLAALFVWRLTAPLWRAVRWPVAFAAALSVAAGFTDLGEELALPQLLMYWPWFVLGLRLRADQLRPLRHRAARRWALPVMAAAAVGAWWAAPRVDREWLLMEAGAHELGLRPLLYVGVRLALFAVGAVLVAAFLALVPAHRTGYTVLGACALYPFLLHGLVVQAVEKVGGYEAVLTGGLLAVVGTTVLAGGLAVLLGLPHVRKVLWPLVEPPFPGWLRGRPARADEEAPDDTAAAGERLPRAAAPHGTGGRSPSAGRPPAVGRPAVGGWSAAARAAGAGGPGGARNGG